MGSGVARIAVEGLRRNAPIALGLTQAQILRFALVSIGAAWRYLLRRPAR